MALPHVVRCQLRTWTFWNYAAALLSIANYQFIFWTTGFGPLQAGVASGFEDQARAIKTHRSGTRL